MARHPVVSFFLLAYALSWLGWLPYVLSRNGLGLLPFHAPQLIALPAAYLGPAFSGLLMTAVTDAGAGVRQLLRRLVLWRVGWRWWLFALVGPPSIVVMGALLVPGVAQAFLLPSPRFAVLFFPVLAFEVLTSGLAEEPGWRGFALPRLQRRHGPLAGTMILGGLWACWHLPLFLTAWQVVGRDPVTIGQFLLGTVALATVFTWVFNHTQGSLLIAVLMHGSFDAFGTVFAPSLFPTPALLRSAYLAILIGFGLAALTLVALTRGRLGCESAPRPSAAASPPSDGPRPPPPSPRGMA